MSRESYGSLGPLEDRQFQAALDRFGLGRLIRAEALTNGLFGKNVALTTDAGEWVLRGDPWPVDDQFRRERFFAAAVREGSDVPVPWPYLIEVDRSLFGWPYALIPRLPGEHVDPARPGGADWDAIAAALGRAAAALRSVRFDTFGSWSPETDGIEPFAGRAHEWLAQRVDGWLAWWADRPPLAPTELAWIAAHVATAGAELDADPPAPGYVHHDLKAGNVVVGEVEGRLAVTGLFDLGEGLVADPLEDLARCTWDLATRVGSDRAAVFIRTYAEAAGITIPVSRLRAYVVLDLLVIWEFGTRPANQWFSESSFEEWSEKMLRRVDRALG